MSEFRRGSRSPIYAFPIGDHFYFKHFFEDSGVFERLQQYYNDEAYRFEVPPRDLPEVRSFLADRGFSLVPTDEIEEFVAVKRQYTDHPDVLFTESVIERSGGGYNFFLMKSPAAVERATKSGATPLVATDLAFPP